MQNHQFADLYKIRACDNQVYGPVNLETLLDWTKDERVLADTWIHCQSDNSWQKAEAIPVLREMLRGLNPAASGQEGSAETEQEEISADELRQFPRLARLTDQELEQMRRFGELCVALPGTRIIRKGDPGEALYLVLTGEVRVRLIMGMEDKTLCTIRSGHFFGEMALFNNSPRSADVVAVTQTRLMRVTQQAFMLFIEEIPGLASTILHTLASMLADRLVAANARYQQDTTAEFLWR
jgi:CRP-like cAMP-binding protein